MALYWVDVFIIVPKLCQFLFFSRRQGKYKSKKNTVSTEIDKESSWQIRYIELVTARAADASTLYKILLAVSFSFCL